MKKFLLAVFSLALAAGLCGCEKSLKPMELRSAPVSEETRQTLELTDNELTLWEYRLNDASYEILFTLWVCQNGSWEERLFFTTPAVREGRLGVHLTASQVEYLTFEDENPSRYLADCPVDVTIESGLCSYSSQTASSTISSGAEIPLLARLGWNDSTDPAPSDWQNFQDSSCDTGVAVTVTFTKEIKS